MPRAPTRSTRWSRTRACKLLIDPKAVLFLLGTEMDFKVDKLSSTLRVQQPEPDLGLRLRRVRAAHAGRRSGERLRRTERSGMDADVVRELFREFGPVAVRRMFGGAGRFSSTG